MELISCQEFRKHSNSLNNRAVKINMTKFAYLFGTLDLQSTCDKWVAAAHYGNPSLILRQAAGAPAPFPGLGPYTVIHGGHSPLTGVSANAIFWILYKY